MSPPKTIGFEVKSLVNLIKRSIYESANEIGLAGLTGVQGWIIGYLYKHMDDPDRPGVFQRDIESEFKIRRSTATGILQLMEKNGLITREPVEFDGRLKRLILTPKAMALHAQIMEKLMEVESKLRRGLSAEEVDSFFMLIEKIKGNLEAVDK